MPGHLPVEHATGHLRGEVARGEPGAAGGDDHVVRRRDRRAQRRLDRLAVGDDRRTVDLEAQLAQPGDQQRAAAVVVDTRRRAGRDGDDERRHDYAPERGGWSALRQVPDRPPVFASTRTSVIDAPLVDRLDHVDDGQRRRPRPR